MINPIFAGAAIVSLFVITLFFLRFWRRTRDRLFLFFAGAFVFMMIERIVRAVMGVEDERAAYVYMIRLASFVLIIIAVVDKNRRS
ncbi:DUF5985 family protein [Prosthecobacter sp.]|uniref:DUF5985 family protein n=1 Tax=Prosthecobacter sp. TaxID=1965333 RepID=UPI0037830E88